MFTTFKTWEIFFAASVSWKVLFLSIYNLDKLLLSGLIYWFLQKLEKVLLGKAGDIKTSIHPLGLELAEEDEWIMVHIFAAQLILLMFPLGLQVDAKHSELPSIISFDCSEATNGLSTATKRVIMSFYRDCVKRHLYVFNNQKMRHLLFRNQSAVKRYFLSKNPPFTLRIETLHTVFPDLKVS